MSRITAFLGLDASGFQAGLDKANTAAERFKKVLKTGDVGNGLKQMIGAGAIIEAFRGIMSAAQDARTKAKELGMEVERGTASVAAYGDRWDLLKDSIKDAGIAALSFFTQVGRSIGQKMGTGSSDDEVRAIKTNEEDQKQREIDLKQNRERIERELATTVNQLGEARRANSLAELSDKQRVLAIEKEIDGLFEKRNALNPQSLAAKKVELEIEKKRGELRDAQNKVSSVVPVDPSARKGRDAFSLSMADVAGSRPRGRQSERERLASQALELEERGKKAASAGRFELASQLRGRAGAIAGKLGFGDVETSVTMARDAAGAGGNSWDAKYGGMLSARNSALNARYGGTFRRPDSFANAKSANDSANDVLQKAAETMNQAADKMKDAVITIDVDEN